MLDGLFSAVSSVTKGSSRNDDDLVDRMNHRYTVIILVIFTVLVTTTQYVGTPIHCWCPAYFTGSHEAFADKMCWVTNTYYLVDPNAVPGQPGGLKSYLGYYQWVPVVLLAQAVLFYVPCLFWRVLNDRSGINVNNLVEAAETIQNALYPERREKTIKYMIRHLDHYLAYQRDYRGGCCSTIKSVLTKCLCLTCGNRFGNYLITLYLFVKLIFLSNVLFQLFLIDRFLGAEYHLYGFQMVADFVSGADRVPARRFPRVTLCDFEIRQMGNIHRHTVQCVLPINLFNEMIYLFLWFWFFALALLNLIGLATWIWNIRFRFRRTRYVRKQLKIMGKLDRGGNDEHEMRLTRQFVEVYLRQDGVFVLKLVAKNSTELVVADIVAALWDNFRNKPTQSRIITDDDLPLQNDDSGDGT